MLCFGNLVFASIAPMLSGNHVNWWTLIRVLFGPAHSHSGIFLYLQLFLSWLKNFDVHSYFIQLEIAYPHTSDRITLSETWLNSSITHLELEIPGYNLHRVDRNSKPGGGVGVYARQTYKVKVLADISNISDNGLHQLWINRQVRNLKSIVICAIYRLPGTPLTCFDTHLTPSLITASLQNMPIYILGDGNCDILKPDCRGAITLTNFCHSFNLSRLVSKPTRVTKTTESLIDVIITSNPQQVIETDVIPSSINDHDLPYVVLRIKKERCKSTYMTARSFKGYVADRFFWWCRGQIICF